MRALNQNLNANLVELVQILHDGEFHDGSSIGNKLNISRASVWKLIKKLEQYQIPITSTKGKGYKLETPLLLLDQKKIQSQLQHKSAKVHVLEKTESTNDYLKKFTHNNNKIIACLTEYQSAGKGRLERQWHSPFAENIYLSLLIPFNQDFSELSGLSLITALAICHAIENVIALPDAGVSVKWPNDILVDGHKLAGILLEIEAESNGYSQLIIGVGINVNMQSVTKKDITQKWTSLYKLCNKYLDRNILTAKLIDTLINYVSRFFAHGITEFMQDWQQRDCLVDKDICIINGKHKTCGTYAGINEKGHLKIKTVDGKILTFSAGDATIAK
jgi:BirA family biotin operon repressor/biotin-[acetyl-CoA-carboxylase] ligase